MLTYVLDLIIHVTLGWRPWLLHSNNANSSFSFKLLKTWKWHVRHTFSLQTPIAQLFTSIFCIVRKCIHVKCNKKSVNNQLVINCMKFTFTQVQRYKKLLSIYSWTLWHTLLYLVVVLCSRCAHTTPSLFLKLFHNSCQEQMVAHDILNKLTKFPFPN